jgi:DNA-binding NarL/FixJ family response regulator
MINIAIADDQLLFRKGMISLLKTFEDIDVVMEADNGKELLMGIKTITNKPHVVLLDLSMPELNGIETAKILHNEYPDMKVLILSVHNEERFITHLLELGANGYLFKNADPEEVLKAIHLVIDVGFYFNEVTIEAMKKRMAKKRSKLMMLDDVSLTLTQREIEVLNLICKQCTAQEIADKLCISARTVDGHRNNLLEKTGARNTAGLVIFAIKHFLIDPVTLL